MENKIRVISCGETGRIESDRRTPVVVENVECRASLLRYLCVGLLIKVEIENNVAAGENLLNLGAAHADSDLRKQFLPMGFGIGDIV